LIRTRAILCAAIAMFPIGLWVDRAVPTLGHAITSLWTWGVLAAIARRAMPTERRALLACVLWATAGELFLTEVCGLYEYHHGFVPLYVPPGHALLFCLGIVVTQRLPRRSVPIVRALTVPVTAAVWWLGGDQLSVFYVAVFWLLCVFGPSPSLYGTMFFLSLALELFGTWLGVWRWELADPWLGFATCNPPVAAGAFYCVLDWLTVSSSRSAPALAEAGSASG
jgi:hypothetical protein